MKSLSELITENAAYTRAGLIKKAESFENPISAHFAKIYLWPHARETNKHCVDLANWITRINNFKCSGKKPKLSDLILPESYPLNSNDLAITVRLQKLDKYEYPIESATSINAEEYAKRVNRLIGLLDYIEFSENSTVDNRNFNHLVKLIKEIMINGNMSIT